MPREKLCKFYKLLKVFSKLKKKERNWGLDVYVWKPTQSLPKQLVVLLVMILANRERKPS